MVTTPARSRGYTLIELMVVIVVVGILAVIVIITYNGIQQRAQNARILAGVRQYHSAIEVYKVRNGAYPKTSLEVANPDALVSMTCLGVGYPDGDCGIVTGVQIHEDGHFNTIMKSVAEPTSTLAEHIIHVTPESFYGAVYGVNAIVNADYPTYTRGRTIQWALLGHNQDCAIKGAYSYNASTTPATTACEILLEPID